MPPPPPAPTLFPSPTLFRSLSRRHRVAFLHEQAGGMPVHRLIPAAVPQEHRSEEHTSELQSHHDLVCRLLLEKKKHRKTLLQSRLFPTILSGLPHVPAPPQH